VEEQFTFEEFLVGLRRIHDYIGEEKWSEFMKSTQKKETNPKEKTPDDLLEEINNFKG
jgi:hypothetical protein